MDEANTPAKRYTLTTALGLIIGICIGSGIFFKSDNILIATGGNVALGVLMFLLAATVIVFGGLTLARFAARTDGHGGLIAYAERFLGPFRLTLIGWHYTFLYLPTVSAIVSWVVGVYATLTFGLGDSFALQVAIGLGFLTVCTIWNILLPRISGYLQNLATVAKVLPLVAVGVIGVIAADPATSIAHGIETAGSAGTGWLVAAAPIAFAFDGWSSALSIAPELRDAKRNLPRALIIGPLVILVLYLGYFLGISCYLGPQTVMEAGDASLALMFSQMFGPQFAALPNVIALVAVAGTANGLVLAMLRMPFALALHDEVPCSHVLSRVNPTLKFPVVSALVAYGATLFWMGVHVIVTCAGLLPNGDISEITVSLTLFVLPLFYIEALREALSLKRGRMRALIAPAIATVSSLAIGISSFSDPTRLPLAILFAGGLFAATLIMRRRHGKKEK